MSTDLCPVVSKKHFIFLDLLKFLLACVIVCHHFQQVTGIVFPHFNFFNGKIYFGYCVEFFFLISGFLAVHTFRSIGFKKYVLKKCIRIYPMAIISVVTWTATMLVFRLVKGVWMDNLVPTINRIFFSITLLFSSGFMRSVELGCNNPIWYLGVLLTCYCIFYFINFICDKNGYSASIFFIFMSLIGIGILDFGINLPLLTSKLARGYMSFFLGASIYKVYKKQYCKIYAIISLLVLMSLFGVYLSTLLIELDIYFFALIINPCILFIFLFFDNCSKFEQKKCILTVMGGVSFDMYLFHSAFIVLFMTFFNECKITYLTMIIFLLCTIIVTLPIHFLVEKKMNGFLIDKLENF